MHWPTWAPSLSTVSIPSRAQPRQTSKYQFDHPIDNGRVEKFVILVQRKTVQCRKLVPSGIQKLVPDRCSVNNTIGNGRFVAFLGLRIGGETVNRRGWS